MLELPPDIGFYIPIVVFCLFAMILRSLVMEPAQKVLAERARRTTGAEAEAEQMRAEAELMQEQFDRTLAEARLAGSTAGEQVRREAEAAEHRIMEQARSDAARLLEEVRARVAGESEAARVHLREQSSTLARLAAEKVLGRSINA